jgi:hypothetical protein
MRHRGLSLLIRTSPPLVLGIVVVDVLLRAARDREGTGGAVAR